ncbi:hypothetical protein [Streptomyces monashensis]|uniref:Uncharacterized protein n=1 Tax=Streptomyces monashensis TaxID=1678012 RepID=A0A1S2QJ58_9ACTN|nr:hypothetical protein [Streptomyces monashensis]OIK05415.1 hypothetical protein BIV23_12640 [Streptomyces monashensis]
MNDTGEPMDALDARRAQDALAAACAARSAARRAGGRDRPRRYLVGQGLAFAAGFTAFGLADLLPRYGTWLTLAGLACAVGFFALVWIGAHHGGVTRWFSRDGGPRRSTWELWGAPLVTIGVGALAAVPYGVAGWSIAFGLATGAEHLLRAFLPRQGSTA